VVVSEVFFGKGGAQSCRRAAVCIIRNTYPYFARQGTEERRHLMVFAENILGEVWLWSSSRQTQANRIGDIPSALLRTSIATNTAPNTHLPHRAVSCNKTIDSQMMANISAGNKRSWEGIDSIDLTKRHRSKDDPRDWRDVHLRDSPGRRDYSRSSPRQRRSRDRDHRRRDYSRDRRRDRDGNDSRRRRSASPRPNGVVRPVDEEREEGE
jgi:hypothetical protein